MLNTEPIELGLKGHEQEFLEKLRQEPVYRRLFPLAFPGETNLYTLANVTKALAAFERTIISMRSPYDRYRWSGDMTAISDAAKRGELVFSSSERGRCFRCHDGWNFSSVRYEGSHEAAAEDGMRGFFNTGVSLYAAPNRGIYEYTKHSADVGKFRAPTLRNIAVTGPYMHDGSLSTLEDVIEHYAAGGKYDDPNKSRILQPLKLSEADKKDLVEFLKSLTRLSSRVHVAGPCVLAGQLVPSRKRHGYSMT
jgi:cytochrome c peroxidase